LISNFTNPIKRAKIIFFLSLFILVYTNLKIQYKPYANKQEDFSYVGTAFAGENIKPANYNLSDTTLFAFLENKLWGFKNEQNIIIPAQFDYADEFSEGFAKVKKNGKWGYINEKGKTVIPFQFAGASNFENGKAVVYKNGNLFYIDTKGRISDAIKTKLKIDFAKLPMPPHSISPEYYAKKIIGVSSKTYAVLVNPVQGETFEMIQFTPLQNGMIYIVKNYWEAMETIFLIPGISKENGVELAKKFVGKIGYTINNSDKNKVVLNSNDGISIYEISKNKNIVEIKLSYSMDN